MNLATYPKTHTFPLTLLVPWRVVWEGRQDRERTYAREELERGADDDKMG